MYHGNFDYAGPDGLIFGGSAYVLGNFSFKSVGKNFVTFRMNSYLRVQGTAEFDDQATWKILVTPEQARDLWRHRSDRNISFIQAAKLTYNARNVQAVPSDSCTIIDGKAKTLNRTENNITSQILVLEFTKLTTYATCRIWWIIPLIFAVVVAIIAISLFCYFKGRNKKAEKENYIPISDTDHFIPNDMLEHTDDDSLHNSYGSIQQRPNEI